MNIIDIYFSFQEQYQKQYVKWNRLFNTVSSLRLLLVIAFIIIVYKAVTIQTMLYILGMIICVILFVILLKIQDYLLLKKNLLQLLVKINQDEIAFLKNEKVAFKNGHEYLNINHAYAYDIDIFGEHSLYQYLNRTITYIGEKKLAQQLLSILSPEEIINCQNAIKELSQKISFRQQLKATASLHQDNKEQYEKILFWSENKSFRLSPIVRMLSFIMPILFVTTIVLYSLGIFSFSWITSIFILNLIIATTQTKKIKSELVNAEKIYKFINNYNRILKVIESENFIASKLKNLQSKLFDKQSCASKKIKILSNLFLNLESINNILGATIFNGFFLYHLHIYHHLSKWKLKYAKNIAIWVDIIGEIEMLNSFGNFACNNPKYIFPTINQDYKIEFQEVVHPLIPNTKRISNDISFSNRSFVVLTGSNMSGKTTFLRTLGVNMILANIGAPVCAQQANVHPLKVWVSIRQMDSLYEGESYFFAEVKRLKTIIQELDKERCFVLLDEILKGTNSEDKHTGTIGIIKKVLSSKVIGCIATHDLEICNMVKEYPKTITNKCFEISIKDDKLICNYKLKNGICKSKSATFLMQKMGII